MSNKTKLLLSLALLASAFGVGLWTASKGSLPSGTVKEKIVYLDRVVTKEVIVNRDVATHTKSTETRPDGTKIETETTTADKTSIKSDTKLVDKTKTYEKTTVTLAKYSLGVSYRPNSIYDWTGVYTAEIGRRILTTPAWATVSFNTKREATIGIRLEF